MHHYPEDQSLLNLNKIARSNVCSECGRQVAVYLDREAHKAYIACSGQVHEGITREYQPPIEDYRSNIRREIQMEQKVGTQVARTVGNIPKQGQLTQPQAMTILKLIYPSAKEDEIIRCAIFCRDFGLHPLANEVYLIPFKKKWKDNQNKWHEETHNAMVVGIPASRKMAHALKGEFSFLDDTPRAATEEEIIKQYGKDSDEARDNIISVTKLKGEGGNFAIGFGLYPKDEKPYGMDKGNTRRNMANIRSERQGMDRLPGKPLPRYDVIDAAYAEVPEVGKVDTATGEIIEGEAVELEPEASPEPTEPVSEPIAEGEGGALFPDSIINISELNDSLTELRKKDIKTWSEESLLGYMRLAYKGVEGNTVFEIASKLDKGKAAHFTKTVQDALDKA